MRILQSLGTTACTLVLGASLFVPAALAEEFPPCAQGGTQDPKTGVCTYPLQQAESARDFTVNDDDCDTIGKRYDPISGTCIGGTSTYSGTPGSINTTYLKGYADSIKGIINEILVPVVVAIAFLLFIWGVFKAYIWSGASDTERAKGHQFILWAVIGFVVIFAVWGLVNMVDSILNFGQAGKTAPRPPTI